MLEAHQLARKTKYCEFQPQNGFTLASNILATFLKNKKSQHYPNDLFNVCPTNERRHTFANKTKKFQPNYNLEIKTIVIYFVTSCLSFDIDLYNCFSKDIQKWMHVYKAYFHLKFWSQGLYRLYLYIH